MANNSKKPKRSSGFGDAALTAIGYFILGHLTVSSALVSAEIAKEVGSWGLRWVEIGQSGNPRFKKSFSENQTNRAKEELKKEWQKITSEKNIMAKVNHHFTRDPIPKGVFGGFGWWLRFAFWDIKKKRKLKKKNQPKINPPKINPPKKRKTYRR